MFYLPIGLADPGMGQAILHISNISFVESTDGTHAPSTINSQANMTE